MDLESISLTLNHMKPGGRFVITRQQWRDCTWRTFEHGTGAEGFLSALKEKLVGSAWGLWRLDIDPLTGDIRVERYHETGTEVYRPPERA